VAAALLAAAACADKAKPDYEKCVKLEAEYKTVEARDACRAAVKADPNSKSGQAAANKLVSLNLEADKIVAREKEQLSHCPSGIWVTRCLYKGKPRPNLLEAPSRAKCNTDSSQLGMVGVTCPDCVCKDRFVEPYDEEQ
jgi:hypothetical protein